MSLEIPTGSPPILQLLSHDNIVNTYAHDLRRVNDLMLGMKLPDGGIGSHWKMYIVQEYCDGGNLAEAIDRGDLMDPVTKLPRWGKVWGQVWRFNGSSDQASQVYECCLAQILIRLQCNSM